MKPLSYPVLGTVFGQLSFSKRELLARKNKSAKLLNEKLGYKFNFLNYRHPDGHLALTTGKLTISIERDFSLHIRTDHNGVQVCWSWDTSRSKSVQLPMSFEEAAQSVLSHYLDRANTYVDYLTEKVFSVNLETFKNHLKVRNYNCTENGKAVNFDILFLKIKVSRYLATSFDYTDENLMELFQAMHNHRVTPGLDLHLTLKTPLPYTVLNKIAALLPTIQLRTSVIGGKVAEFSKRGYFEKSIRLKFEHAIVELFVPKPYDSSYGIHEMSLRVIEVKQSEEVVNNE